jgi:hypothetical protein
MFEKNEKRGKKDEEVYRIRKTRGKKEKIGSKVKLMKNMEVLRQKAHDRS